MGAAEAFRLDGQVGVVTGAFGKLGPLWSRCLLEAGARVVALDLHVPKVHERIDELRERFTGRVLVRRCDIRDKGDLRAALDACLETFGPPEILVNNAGIDQPPANLPQTYDVQEMPLDTFRAIVDVNLVSTFLVCQIFGGEMASRRRGSIINIGSLYATVSPDPRVYDHIPVEPPFLKPPGYGASKAGLINLTRYLAVHWARRGVRVNALSPGGVQGNQDPEFQRKFCERVPMARMAQESDLTGPLLFLASSASAYMTGVNLHVDGGFTLW